MSGIHFVQMSDEEFVKEAIRIVHEAESRGVCLRILGSVAAYIRCLNKGCVEVIKSVGRFGNGMPLFTDLDLVGYSMQTGDIKKLFHELNFKPDTLVNSLFGHKRLVYYHPEDKYHIDIFLNKLEFSHELDFGRKPGSGRLELDYPTISPTDIVLEKLQIHEINRKDLVDLISLFMVHDVQEQFGKGVVDGEYITKILSDEWGFWYDSMTNLDKVKSLVEELTREGKLPVERSQTILQRIDKLLKAIADSPKTRDWEKRAKAGTSKPWYREVEEIVR